MEKGAKDRSCDAAGFAKRVVCLCNTRLKVGFAKERPIFVQAKSREENGSAKRDVTELTPRVNMQHNCQSVLRGRF